MAMEDHIESADGFFTGTDTLLDFTVYEDDETTPQNITGWAISWLLKKRKGDSDANAKIAKTTSSGITVTSAPGGTLTVSVIDDDTSGLEAGTYYHELKRTDSGNETVLTHGKAVLRKAVHE